MRTKFALIIAVMISSAGNSQWSNDLSENNIVSWNTWLFITVSDMQNGVIVAHQTHPQNPIIYAQRMSVDGVVLWPGDKGVRISDSNDEQWLVYPWDPQNEFVLSDGTGGCYVAFQNARHIGKDTSGEMDLYDVSLHIQRIDATGNRLFGSTGLAVMPGEPDSTNYTQQITHWCLDGNNGLYIVWWRSNKDSPDKNGVYLARISGEGEIVWGPIKFASSSADELIPYLDSNLNLNLYYDRQKNRGKFYKVNPNSGEIISEKDIKLNKEQSNASFVFEYCSVKDFSTVFVFYPFRTDTLWAQKLDEDGNKLWGDDPVMLEKKLLEDGLRGFEIEPDQRGGVYILYKIARDATQLVHLDDRGLCLWENELLSDNLLGAENDNISADSNGDLFVLQEKMKFLTKFNYSSEHRWTTQVTSRDTLANWIPFYEVVADSFGGCIVLWQEVGNRFYGIRAQRVDRNGILSGPSAVELYATYDFSNPAQITALYPNPFNESVATSFFLPNPEKTSLKIFDIRGREVTTLTSGFCDRGEHTFYWRGTDRNERPVASGVYFLVLRSGVTHISRKFILIR